MCATESDLFDGMLVCEPQDVHQISTSNLQFVLPYWARFPSHVLSVWETFALMFSWSCFLNSHRTKWTRCWPETQNNYTLFFCNFEFEYLHNRVYLLGGRARMLPSEEKRKSKEKRCVYLVHLGERSNMRFQWQIRHRYNWERIIQNVSKMTQNTNADISSILSITY